MNEQQKLGESRETIDEMLQRRIDRNKIIPDVSGLDAYLGAIPLMRSVEVGEAS